MKSYKLFFLVLFVNVSLLLVSGCKKFVEVGPPNSQLVATSVYQNAATATAVVTQLYSAMNHESYSASQAGGLLSDELTNYSTSELLLGYYHNAMFSKGANGYSFGAWITAYPYIYRANAVLEGLQNNPNIDAASTAQLTGEAKFIRAYWYFYLTNEYGAVPITTSTNYLSNELLSRSSPDSVYRQIISDLTDAENLLSSQFVDATDTAVTTERVRPTKWAAAALLARTYLYTGKYDSAEIEATRVIDQSSLFALCVDLNQVFLMNSTEAIWQLQTAVPFNDGATLDGEAYILLGAPGQSSTNSATISPQLMSSFEAGDQRKAKWIGVFTDSTVTPAATYYFPFKYKVETSTEVTEYVMMLRLGEQYLIRAESRAQQNELSGAAEDLNILRNRAGLANTTAASQADMLSAVYHERQTELFTEWAHRWFDLNRTGQVNAVMSVVSPQKGGTWLPTDHLMPVPQSERTSDRNLTQNSGY